MRTISPLLIGITGGILFLMSQASGAEAKQQKYAHNFTIKLRLVSGKELRNLLGDDTSVKVDDYYLLGNVINSSPKSAYIRLRVSSANNPAVSAKEIPVGWIPPNGAQAVYFLEYLMQPILKTSIEDVELDYQITSINYK